MFKFGRSTRMYILGGPANLMPEEGLTKKQAQEVKVLEVRPCGAIPLECSCHESHRAGPAMQSAPHQFGPQISSGPLAKCYVGTHSWQAKEVRKKPEAQVAKVLPLPCTLHRIVLVLRCVQALKCLLAWQAKEARKEREAQVAKVQMEAALSKGVSWGMAGDDQVLAFFGADDLVSCS